MTKHTQITAEIRTIHGNSLRKLRKQGILPAVLFSKDIESVSLQLNYLQFLRTYKEAGKSHVIDVTVDSKIYPCIVNGLDIHPVTGRLRHVDLLLVNLKRKVTATVPINFIGESPAVKEFGAVLMTPLQEIEVEALPDKLPESIEVDLNKLVTLSDIIRVEDLLASSDYEIVTEQDTILATLVNNSDSDGDSESVVEAPVADETATVSNN
jgi:large subunit ribosomal protein L25